MKSVKINCGYDAGEKTALHPAIARSLGQEIGSGGNAASRIIKRRSGPHCMTCKSSPWVLVWRFGSAGLFAFQGHFFEAQLQSSTMIICSHSPP